MEIRITTGDIAQFRADAILLAYYEGIEDLTGTLGAIDKVLDGAVSQCISSGEIKGKVNEITVIHTLGKLPAARIVVTGLGKRSELNLDKIRQSIAGALRWLASKSINEIAAAALGAGVAGITYAEAAQSIVEGALLGLYDFRKHITKKPEYGEMKLFTIVEADAGIFEHLKVGSERGLIISEAAILARDMVNEPANYMTPTRMAETARQMADEWGLKLNVLERAQMQELGMGALLGVSQGSAELPKFIVLRYKGNDSERIDIALVGKGITFDSGGISLKPSDGMGDMKGDMAGGASVMATLVAIARLRLEINAMAVIPATENMPGGSAFKPGDILTAMSGKTIEIISTDAEGRLILADALAYTRTFDVGYIIDVATLTGACHIALGEVCTGVFGNNQELVDRVVAAGKEAGELMWQMPMFDQYKELNTSDVADIKNSGGRWGGAITAAQFLAEFAGDKAWVHLDIAGTSSTEKEKGYVSKGATGIPVRTLINVVLSLAKKY